MSVFREQLHKNSPDTKDRRWVLISYDQLTDELGPLRREEPEELGIVMVETLWKGRRRPYHKQKLALVLTNMRHFALEQAARGVAVRYETGDGPYHEVLRPVSQELGPLRVMCPAEYELRQDLAGLLEEGLLEELPHEGWLTDAELFQDSQGGNKTWRMDSFYRAVRKRTGVLMDEDGEPEGGKYSFDKQNREPWDGEPEAPSPPTFEPDSITEEVLELVEHHFSEHPGQLRPERLPATREDAQAVWDWARAECMEHFGPYEDAMSVSSRTLFHTHLSPLLNLLRLPPERVLEDALALDIPLHSKEGFVRQLLGWREFIYHVHASTDGFRSLPTPREQPRCADVPGDARWSTYTGGAWEPPSSDPLELGAAAPSELGAAGALPQAFWGEPSGMFCLDHVVEGVLEHGWSHHIERLMVLSNLATLLDVSPRELTDWFWAAYIDAYDWVVEPNVLGMGTFGLGDLFTTKPYVSGANYIHKMGDFCPECQFNPNKDCPITNLYWAFLARHADELEGNPRMNLVYANLKRRSEARRDHDEAVFDHIKGRLAAGESATPEELPELEE